MNDIKNVCVYSASSTKIAPIYFEAAQELGKLLARQRINLINGAGCLGLMCSISDAALAAGGTVTGVIPHFMVEQGWHHKGLTKLIETESMHERKKIMAIFRTVSLHCQEVAEHWKNCLKSLHGNNLDYT